MHLVHTTGSSNHLKLVYNTTCHNCYVKKFWIMTSINQLALLWWFG